MFPFHNNFEFFRSYFKVVSKLKVCLSRSLSWVLVFNVSKLTPPWDLGGASLAGLRIASSQVCRPQSSSLRPEVFSMLGGKRMSRLPHITMYSISSCRFMGPSKFVWYTCLHRNDLRDEHSVGHGRRHVIWLRSGRLRLLKSLSLESVRTRLKRSVMVYELLIAPDSRSVVQVARSYLALTRSTRTIINVTLHSVMPACMEVRGGGGRRCTSIPTRFTLLDRKGSFNSVKHDKWKLKH